MAYENSRRDICIGPTNARVKSVLTTGNVACLPILLNVHFQGELLHPLITQILVLLCSQQRHLSRMINLISEHLEKSIKIDR